jgi:hypothetical protein
LLEKLTIIDSRMIQFGDIHMHLWIWLDSIDSILVEMGMSR